MNIKEKLSELSLNTQNSIVIGSGILNALKIRESSDIDLVVDKTTYQKLKRNPLFKITKPFNRQNLEYDTFDIGLSWNIPSAHIHYSFEEIFKNSQVIDDVRYISLEFLLKIKKMFLNSPIKREKDVKDIELIEKYLNNKQ